jgi:hypothetical protein
MLFRFPYCKPARLFLQASPGRHNVDACKNARKRGVLAQCLARRGGLGVISENCLVEESPTGSTAPAPRYDEVGPGGFEPPTKGL